MSDLTVIMYRIFILHGCVVILILLNAFLSEPIFVGQSTQRSVLFSFHL
jgi:hypothetical protein